MIKTTLALIAALFVIYLVVNGLISIFLRVRKEVATPASKPEDEPGVTETSFTNTKTEGNDDD